MPILQGSKMVNFFALAQRCNHRVLLSCCWKVRAEANIYHQQSNSIKCHLPVIKCGQIMQPKDGSAAWGAVTPRRTPCRHRYTMGSGDAGHRYLLYLHNHIFLRYWDNISLIILFIICLPQLSRCLHYLYNYISLRYWYNTLILTLWPPN